MKQNIANWIEQPKITQVLHCFTSPKTPREVERELGIKKLKLKPFLEKRLLKSLNPEARKGRYYLLTNKAKRLLKLSLSRKDGDKAWDLIGWINSSPRQRLVILKTIDSKKRTSEEIRKDRASRLNPCLSRISTKQTLKGLIKKGLVESELEGRYRLYWVSEGGRLLQSFIAEF